MPKLARGFLRALEVQACRLSPREEGVSSMQLGVILVVSTLGDAILKIDIH